jgi:hypothetical protein
MTVMKRLARSMIVAALACAGMSAFANPQTLNVDFSAGELGWVNLPLAGDQGSWIEPASGVDGTPGWRTRNVETWGLTWRNSANPAFVGDYASAGSVTLSVDVKANSIQWQGIEVSRDLVLELRNYRNPPNGAPYSSVWFKLGTIARSDDWQHLQVTIRNTGAHTLPPGWQAYTGTLDFKLPKGVTFGDMLKNVDEVAITTFVPGRVYDWTYYDVLVDNISMTANRTR